MLIDMTNGRRTKAVIIADSGHVILAALAPDTIAGRLQTGSPKTISRGRIAADERD